jgi:hypothetical protein
MVEVLLWIAVGAIAGSVLGAYQCADMNKASPKHGHVVHIGICAAAGAIGGAVLFLLAGGLLYGQSPFSF